MKSLRGISLLFALAAVYDAVLGFVFLFAPGPVFEWFDVVPPNHPGYVQFPAALLITFALMFVAIAVDPAKNRNLIPYGVLLKVSYCGVVAKYWFTTGLPGIWKPFCIADAVFLVLFVLSWLSLKKPVDSSAAGG
ncbi:MAG TPA: hypothetical protein VMN36_01760 [Verrucomicrobiales bacterium]|nr:hypothetical protein [Verrucomicrobiales bacterium]